MKNQMQLPETGRSTALIRLLGIGAVAALATLCWIAAGASAAYPTVTAEYGGWAEDAPDEIKLAIEHTPQFEYSLTDPLASVVPGSDTWNCQNYRCHYLNVSWSGITPNRGAGQYPYTIRLTRNVLPSAADVGVTEEHFELLFLAARMSLPTLNTAQQYVPLPWHGERVTVSVIGAPGSGASDFAVKIPENDLPPGFNSRAAAGGAALVQDPNNSNLPMVLAVWPKLDGATHYEVQYTLRTRSRQSGQKLTKVTRILSPGQLDGYSGQYTSLNPNWAQHPNASVLSNLGAGNFDGSNPDQWMAALTTLPELLAGAEGWPSETVGGAALAAEADIIAALGRGKNAVAIRIRPVLACGAYHHTLCSGSANFLTAVLAQWGKQSRISPYVMFKGDNLAEWISSAGTAR